MNNDLISRSALKEEFAKHEDRKGYLIGDWEDIIDNAPTIPIQRDVWELYERYQPRLATNVYEFGVELKELLSRYDRGDKE